MTLPILSPLAARALAALAGATLLLLAAVVTTALMRSRPAAHRHLVWHLALAGAAALAILAPLVPGVPVRLAFLPPRPEAVSLPSSPSPAVAAESPARAPAPELAPGAVPSPARPPSMKMPAIGASSLVALWLLGVIVLASRWALGFAGLARLARTAAPIDDQGWLGLLDDEARRESLRARIRLLRSNRVGSPLTWQMRSLVLMLPDDALDWPTSRRRAVLAHELAHAERGDHGSSALASATCALFWFHPLIWYAARAMRHESERACDDRVLALGTPGGEYAALLLDVARRSRTLRLAGGVAVGMARRSQLEGRLLAVLDDRLPRHVPSRRALALAWTALAALVVPLAALRPLPLRAAEAQADAAGNTAGPDRRYTVNAGSGERLEVDLEAGGSLSVGGWDQSKVEVQAHLGGRDWEGTRVSLDRVSGGVRLHAWQQGGQDNVSTSHQFVVRVPRKFDLDVSSAGGEITLADLEGEFRGHTGGGSLRLEHLKGEASLSTGGGGIRVSDSELGGRVSTGGGEVVLSRVTGGLKGSSGSGPVVYRDDGSGGTADLNHLHVHDSRIDFDEDPAPRADGAGLLHVTRAGGDIDLDEAPKGAELKTGGGDVTVGRSGGRVSATTGGGDIRIGPCSGSVWARTGAGEVTITIVQGDGAEHTVDVMSGTGATTLELPANLSARFELETAYTREFDGRTHIKSDFPLNLSETSDWDASQGSPRRYVRGTGTAGKGGGVIRVKIVNGDITIRKRKS